jgi:anthranilate synthase component 2
MNVLLLDNYDSFTYNLKQLIDQFGVKRLDIIKNDKIRLEDVAFYDKIMLSPGAGLPRDAGSMSEIIRKYAPSKSILGVCLGHHAIAEAFGGKLYNLEQAVHGLSKTIAILKNDILFEGVPNKTQVGLYHSWAVSQDEFPTDLEIIARSEENITMALRHKKYKLKGIQFHPESIMTPYGKTIIWNWLKEEL